MHTTGDRLLHLLLLSLSRRLWSSALSKVQSVRMTKRILSLFLFVRNHGLLAFRGDGNAAGLRLDLLLDGSRNGEDSVGQVGRHLVNVDVVTHGEALGKLGLGGRSLFDDLSATRNVHDLAVVLQVNVHVLGLNARDVDGDEVLAVDLVDFVTGRRSEQGHVVTAVKGRGQDRHHEEILERVVVKEGHQVVAKAKERAVVVVSVERHG